MKMNTTKKTYLLLPDLIKEARQKQQRQNKQNISLASNSKIPVSKFLESTLKPIEPLEIKITQSPSVRQNYLFDEDEFIKQQLKSLRLKEQKKSIDHQQSVAQTVSSNPSKQKIGLRQSVHSRKSSLDARGSKSSNKKSQSKGRRNLLKNIKANQTEKNTIMNNSSIQNNRDILKDIDTSSRQQIEPVLNFLEQIKNTDKLLFDPSKFEKFLSNIKTNKEFHKALRTFVYSYFIQNELND